MASALALFLLSLVGLIGQSAASIDVTFERVPCGRCVHPPCGRCGLTIRRGQQARQTTTVKPISTERQTQSTSTTRRPTRRTSTTRRPTQRTSTTRRPTRQPTTPRRPTVQPECGQVVVSDHRVFCSRDQFACQDFRTCVPACRRSTAKF